MESNDLDPLDDAPLLRSIPRTDPFQVPEGFFERFPHQLQSVVKRPRPLRTRLAEYWYSLHPAFRMAGVSLVLLLMALPFFLERPNVSENSLAQTAAAEVDAVDALYYDEESLLAALAADDEAFTAVGQGISDDDLTAYVEQQELPLELIAEEL